MDFHSLSRRDLQALCKKNGIPANITNVAMADALEALQTVEGIEEIKETSQFQSPVKAKVKSPNPPRTSRRTSARRAPVPDEAKEQQGSPLPRARRVAIKASEIMKLVSEGEEEKKGGPEEIPVTPAVRTGRKPQAAPSTRTRTSKKEEKEPQEDEQKQEDGLKEIPKTPAASTVRNTRRRANKTQETKGHEGPLEAAITPATRYSLRASTRRGAEAPMVGQETQEEAVGLRTARRTGRYINKQLEETAMDAAPNVVRRTARAKAAVKTVVLAQEEGEEQDIAPKNSTDQNNDPVRIPGEKSDEVLMEEDVKNGTISDRDSEVNDDGPNGLQDSSTDGTDDGANKETKNSTPMGKNLGTEAEGESPIKGLISSEPNQETNQEEEEEPMDGTLEENPTVTDGRSEEERRGADNLDFALPDPSHSDDIPANGEDSGHHLPETQAAGVSPLVQENLAVELHDEIKPTGDQILEDLIQSEEEEASLELSPIGESLEDSSDEPPVDQAPEAETTRDLQSNLETGDAPVELPYEIPIAELVDQAPEAETTRDLQSNLETGDAPVELPYEIPIAETDDSGNGFEIPEDTEESGTGILVGNQMAPETDISRDLQSNIDTGDAPAELTYQIPATETDTSGDGIEIPEDPEESSTGIPIGNQMAPEPESVLEAAASSPLQQSPSTFVIVQCSDATGSPAKILTLDANQIGGLADFTVGSPARTQIGDLIGKPADSGIGSPAVKTLSQVGDLIGLISGMESLVKTAVELGDQAGDFEDSDLGTRAPVDGIISEVEGGEKESAAVDIYMPESGGGDDTKENSSGTLPKGLTALGGGEAKVQCKAEKPSLPDYGGLSMRKLKALLKEKVEGKRTALTELNDNRV